MSNQERLPISQRSAARHEYWNLLLRSLDKFFAHKWWARPRSADKMLFSTVPTKKDIEKLETRIARLEMERNAQDAKRS